MTWPPSGSPGRGNLNIGSPDIGSPDIGSPDIGIADRSRARIRVPPGLVERGDPDAGARDPLGALPLSSSHPPPRHTARR
jgi:hypothetical protein